jgi:hypothetical protein
MPLPNDRISVEARRVEMPASPLRATADTMLDEIGLTPEDRSDPEAKSASGGDLPGFERHAVPERFELSDEAFGGAVGVLACVVVAAEVAV